MQAIGIVLPFIIYGPVTDAIGGDEALVSCMRAGHDVLGMQEGLGDDDTAGLDTRVLTCRCGFAPALAHAVPCVQAGRLIAGVYMVGVCLLWTFSYVFRVGTKDMTYSKQLKQVGVGFCVQG